MRRNGQGTMVVGFAGCMGLMLLLLGGASLAQMPRPGVLKVKAKTLFTRHHRAARVSVARAR